MEEQTIDINSIISCLYTVHGASNIALLLVSVENMMAAITGCEVS